MTADELAKWADAYVTPPYDPTSNLDIAPGMPPEQGITDTYYKDIYALAEIFDWKISPFPGALVEWKDEDQQQIRIVAAHVSAARVRADQIRQAIARSKELQEQAKKLAGSSI